MRAVSEGTNWMKRGGEHVPAELRTDIAHSARIYDFILGGKDNFAADRAAAAEIVEHQPTLPMSMRANRNFMVRMTRYLVSELGIRQFLDIGTGLPTSPNLHEAAQSIAPESRILYVDSDPIVLAHARALLTSTPEGATAYLHADLRDPDSILTAPELAETLDLSRPVGLTLIAIMQLFTDDDEARGLVQRLLEPLVPGSALAMSIVPDDPLVMAGNEAYKRRGIPMRGRSKAEAEGLFAGLELVEPGVTRVTQWHPDGPIVGVENHMYGGVAVKR
jgi:hypothetical protein